MVFTFLYTVLHFGGNNLDGTSTDGFVRIHTCIAGILKLCRWTSADSLAKTKLLRER